MSQQINMMHVYKTFAKTGFKKASCVHFSICLNIPYLIAQILIKVSQQLYKMLLLRLGTIFHQLLYIISMSRQLKKNRNYLQQVNSAIILFYNSSCVTQNKTNEDIHYMKRNYNCAIIDTFICHDYLWLAKTLKFLLTSLRTLQITLGI